MLTKERITQAIGKLLCEPFEESVVELALKSYLLEHVPSNQWLSVAVDLKKLEYQGKDVNMMTSTIMVRSSQIPDDYECYNAKLVVFTATGSFDIEVE